MLSPVSPSRHQPDQLSLSAEPNSSLGFCLPCCLCVQGMLSCYFSCFSVFASGFVSWPFWDCACVLLPFYYSSNSNQTQIFLSLCFLFLFEFNKGLLAMLAGNDLALHIRLGLTTLFAICIHDYNNRVLKLEPLPAPSFCTHIFNSDL